MWASILIRQGAKMLNVINTLRDFVSTMSDRTLAPEYDELADVFWRLGVMQSPSELQGRLAGQLAVGETLSAEQWLQQTKEFLDPVGEVSDEDRRTLLDLHSATCSQVGGGGLNLELLIPDDTVEMSQRVESLGQWCQGFLKGFAMAGKALQQRKGQQQYSAELSEILSDMAAISQAGISDDETDLESGEQYFFEINEYLRMAAITVYYECTNPPATLNPQTDPEELESRVVSPSDLFNNKTIH
jgi:uncharacterized protein